MTRPAGIVLVGGASSRMGAEKAALDWHGTSFLRRAVGIVGRVCAPVVVVRAPGQALPALPPSASVVDDAAPGLGPLAGLLAGLLAVAGSDSAFVAAVDLPLLHPAVVAAVVDALAAAPAADIAVPVVGGHRQPLAAAYRASVAERAAAQLAAGRARLRDLVDEAPTLLLDAAVLAADPRVARHDAGLASFVNVNDAAALAAARGRPAPYVEVVGAPGAARQAVRAWSLAAALLAVGVVGTEGPYGVEVDGAAAVDGDEPLVEGDTVQLVYRR